MSAVVECTHTRVKHQHGDRQTYVSDHCRCVDCRAANAAYQNRRSRLAAYGRPVTDLTDARPIQEHIEQLRSQGMGYQRVAEVAGLASETVALVAAGGRRQLRARTARRILAVQLDLADGALIDGSGTRRRLQALAAVGWTWADIGRHIGWGTPMVQELATGTGTVRVATARTVRAAYEELWKRNGGDTRARRRAARNGWPPPMWWDDDHLDDPTHLGADRYLPPEPEQPVASTPVPASTSSSGPRRSCSASRASPSRGSLSSPGCHRPTSRKSPGRSGCGRDSPSQAVHGALHPAGQRPARRE